MYEEEKVTIWKDQKFLVILIKWMMIYLSSNLLNSWVLSPLTFVNLSFSYKDKFWLEARINALSRMMLPYERPRDSTKKTKPNSGKNVFYTHI